VKARIRDTEIWFDIDGAGLVADGPRMVERPVMFALHGGPGGDHTYYKPVLDPLTDRCQIVYVDHRGQGRSARGPRETYTLDNNVDDLDALRDHLGLEKIVLFGTSYGGMVALAYAARYPDRVSHLIASVTSAYTGGFDRPRNWIREHGTEDQIRVAEKLWEGNFQTEEELFEYFEVTDPLYTMSWKPDASKDGLYRGIYSIDAINEGFSGFLRTFDIRDELKNITAPTLVIGGRHDWILPVDLSEELAGRIPNAELRIFEESGHSVLYDETEKLFDVIRGFLVYNNSGSACRNPSDTSAATRS
jgi:proline iminopeptidase